MGGVKWAVVAGSLGVAALVGAADPLPAQSAPPFSRIDLSISAAGAVGRDRLHDFWHPEPGAALHVSTPFYLGSAALLVHRMPFSPIEPDLLDMDALSVSIEWNADMRIFRGLQATAGIRVGQTTFKFRTQEERIFMIEESELLSGVQAGLVAPITGNWRISLASSHQRIFTAVPIDLSFTTIGLGYSFRTPSWLRTILE